ncbi:BON domain-containing protein [Sphingopyxis terrae]|uniref:BON domain-containing protein n=3 Tax=Sphingopyxis terrae TaxID=33052 RepID=A0A1Y6FP48_9SPHN|nr:BON domain-containing protein [Sphingopyxis terrae subsp. ummariensis]SMQ76507.1 BON domain-containing protein [Sphingopyxis terrae subsp. ummariensis]
MPPRDMKKLVNRRPGASPYGSDGDGLTTRRSRAPGDRPTEADRADPWGYPSYGRIAQSPRGKSRVGMGPRAYQRADALICEDICERMMADSRLDASRLDVRVAAGEVSLSGAVDSRQSRRRAEDIAEAVRGVRHVRSDLRIQDGLHTLPKRR